MDDLDDILDELDVSNPDEEGDHSYDWPDEFLQRILGSLLADGYFLTQCANLIKPEYFREDTHRFICRSILKYYEDYKATPDKTILKVEIEEKYGHRPDKIVYIAELETICKSYYPGVEAREYFLNKVTEFAKTQALRSAYNKTLDIFNKKHHPDKWTAIRDVLTEALLVDRHSDIGLDYFDTVESRYARMMASQEERDFFPTGFENIDLALEGGISRGEAAAFAGLSGSGKSLGLVKAGKVSLIRGMNVLYISLEISEDKTAERFDAMLTQVPIYKLYQGRNPTQVRNILAEGVGDWGKLIIKQFPAGSADVNTCRAFINQLHLQDIRPDMVIVDYVGEMRDIPGMKTYESRQRLVRDLRGMATELNVAVFTALQVNRGGRDAIETQGYIDDDQLADSAGQVRPLDALWTISQTPLEQKANCGKLFASKHRSGQARFLVNFYRDPNTLEMYQISNERYTMELSKVKDKVSEEMTIEDMAKNNSFKPNKG